MLKIIVSVVATIVAAQGMARTVVLWSCQETNGARILVEANTVGNSKMVDTNATSVIKMVGAKEVENVVGFYGEVPDGLSDVVAVMQGNRLVFDVSNDDGSEFSGFVQLSPNEPQVGVSCTRPNSP